MTTLTPEQRLLGRENFHTTIGVTRRDFLKAAAVAPALGAFYFGYKPIDKPVRAAIIGTGNEGCGAMIHDHNRDYLDFIGYCDIRPSNQLRAVKEFTAHKQYSEQDVKALRQYADEQEMLDDKDVEVVVIALPLWLHAPAAIRAMKAGKHVFCEKLMAHSVAECKEMCRVARDTNRLLAIGHQRHYSVLYDNANWLVQSGALGDIRHIRALWHRNNACPQIAKNKDGTLRYDDDGEPVYVRDEAGNIVYFDSWKPPIPVEDQKVDYKKYGYESLDELVRWRLYDRTGAGLMAELGSHQLDACSIFLGKQHPLAVTGFGGTYFYTDGREVDDHVFVSFEFPGLKSPVHTPTKDERVIVTYSSITTNAFENYGEQLMGNRGTMIVEGEREILLYKEIDRNTYKGEAPRTTSISVEGGKKGKPVLETSPSLAGPSAATSIGNLATDAPSRGYREELEHFASCVRNGDASNYYGILESGSDDEKKTLLPRCRGEVALADAVIALTSNIAMRKKLRIEFRDEWFDYKSDENPEGPGGALARR